MSDEKPPSEAEAWEALSAPLDTWLRSLPPLKNSAAALDRAARWRVACVALTALHDPTHVDAAALADLAVAGLYKSTARSEAARIRHLDVVVSNYIDDDGRALARDSRVRLIDQLRRDFIGWDANKIRACVAKFIAVRPEDIAGFSDFAHRFGIEGTDYAAPKPIKRRAFLAHVLADCDPRYRCDDIDDIRGRIDDVFRQPQRRARRK